MDVVAGVALAFLGVSVMTPQAADRLLNTERRYGSERQRRPAGTSRRRRQVRAISAVVGLCFVSLGLLMALRGAYFAVEISGP